HEDIKISRILESESNLENENARSNRVDLLVENSRKELIIVEILHETEYDFLQRRLFGVSKPLVEHIKKFEAYAEISKAISISIVDFDLGQGDDYAYRGRTEFVGINTKDVLKLNQAQQELYKTEEIGDIYPEYYILKINKFNDVARNTVEEWIYFLKNEVIKDSFTAKGLKEAREELDILKLSDQERRAYNSYLENLHYKASMYESHYTVGKMAGEKNGERRGILKGEKEGERRGILKGER
ncbi:MAG: hypothetical protein GY765_43245, partial [bacterium]|nr:hypothetical protein [bacterium]